MELNDWIDEVGQQAPKGTKGYALVAEILGEKPRTVASWYRFERAPTFASAVGIVAKSGGRVDFNGIYGPLARKVYGLEASQP